MKNKKIFITGATGFIGSYITRYLTEQEYKQIFCLVRVNSDRSLLEDAIPSINWLTGDLQDFVLLDEYISTMDIVIHAAALVSFDPNDKKMLEEINVQGTATLVNLSLAHKIEKFIYISSISSLGRTDAGNEIDERSSWKDSPDNSNYAISKYKGELEVWRGMEEGLNACILNPGIVLGAGKWGKSSTRLFDYIYNGGRFISQGINSFVDVRDVAIICEKALTLDIRHDRFILSAENSSYKDIFQKIALNLNKSIPNIQIPFWMGGIIWRMFKIWAAYSGSKPLITKETYRTSNRSYYYVNRKSVKLFKHKYIPIDKTIQETSEILLESSKSNRDFGILSF